MGPDLSRNHAVAAEELFHAKPDQGYPRGQRLPVSIHQTVGFDEGIPIRLNGALAGLGPPTNEIESEKGANERGAGRRSEPARSAFGVRWEVGRHTALSAGSWDGEESGVASLTLLATAVRKRPHSRGAAGSHFTAAKYPFRRGRALA